MAFDGRESVQLLGVSSSALFRSGSVPNRKPIIHSWKTPSCQLLKKRKNNSVEVSDSEVSLRSVRAQDENYENGEDGKEGILKKAKRITQQRRR